MKKIAIILTALTMVFALAGCNQNTEPNSSDSSAQTSSQVSESESSSTSSSEPSSSSEQPVDDYVEEGEHTLSCATEPDRLSLRCGFDRKMGKTITGVWKSSAIHPGRTVLSFR